MKLIVLSGLFGAGKSTKARELSSLFGFEIVARDDLRKFPPEFSEGELTFRLIETARAFLKIGTSVIIDSCNLHLEDEKRWKALGEEFSIPVEWIHLSTSLSVCIARDGGRPFPNGKEVILNLANQYSDRLQILSGNIQ